MSQPAKIQPVKTQPAKAPEPSMDEILASIRRSIVPEDDADRTVRKPASRKPVNGKGRAADDETAPEDDDGIGEGTDGSADLHVDAPSGSLEAEAGRPAMNGIAGQPADTLHAETPLLSPHTSAAIDTAFNALTHTVLSQNPRTLEDLVRDMLKPMLKAWLDANLPGMVERMVRAEIERVSRRG